MAARAAITLSKGKGSWPAPTLHLRCRVKPGTDKMREGVTGLADDELQLCVAAPPREGEANKAVLKVLSEVLKVPKSDLRVIQGLKSKNKIVELAVHGRSGAGDEQGNDLIACIYKRLAGQAQDLEPKDRR